MPTISILKSRLASLDTSNWPREGRFQDTPARLPQHADGLHVHLGLGEGIVDVGLLSCPSKILSDHLRLRNPWLPTQRPKLRDIREDVAGIADAVETGQLGLDGDSRGLNDQLGELTHGHATVATDVEDLVVGPTIVQHKEVGLHHVVDGDVVALLLTVLVDDGG